MSTALIHYHFATKQRLLVAAAGRALAVRSLARISALRTGAGLAALDALWEALARGAADGTERVFLELVGRARDDPEMRRVVSGSSDAVRSALQGRLPALLHELGSAQVAAADETARAVAAFLDGTAVALVTGGAAARVRSAYDAFWLALVAAGQSARRP